MKKILVVDDEQSIVKLCSTVLTTKGYEVLVTSDGRKAVDLAREAEPDLVIMDVNLPGLDGLGAAFLLRSNPDTHEIPILAMSGQSADRLREEAIHLGCIDFLQKPFLLTELLSEVERILEGRKRPAR